MKHWYRVAVVGALAGVVGLTGVASADKAGQPNSNSGFPTGESGCSDFVDYGPNGVHFVRDNLEEAQQVDGVYPSIAATFTLQVALAAPPCRKAQYQLNVFSAPGELTVSDPTGTVPTPLATVPHPQQQLATTTSYTVDAPFMKDGVELYPITWSVHFNDYALLPKHFTDSKVDGFCVLYDGEITSKGVVLDRAPDDSGTEFRICYDGSGAVSAFH